MSVYVKALITEFLIPNLFFDTSKFRASQDLQQYDDEVQLYFTIWNLEANFAFAILYFTFFTITPAFGALLDPWEVEIWSLSNVNWLSYGFPMAFLWLSYGYLELGVGMRANWCHLERFG